LALAGTGLVGSEAAAADVRATAGEYGAGAAAGEEEDSGGG
jgi:hypothetical protein